jgi:hypothetical protein
MASIKHLVDLDLNKNQLLNAVVQNLGTAPATPNDGQIYWDTNDDTLYVWSADGSVWIDLGSDGITNLDYTAGVSNGVVTSSSGTDATIPLADGTNAGLMTAAEKTKVGNTSGTNSGDNATNSQYSGLVSNVSTNLSEGTATNTSVVVNSSDGTNATLAAASTSRAGVMSKAKFDEVEANTTAISGLSTNVVTNLSEGATTTTSVVVESSDGSDATLLQASTTRAGVMSSAKFDEVVANTAKVSDINHNVSTNLGITKSATTNVITSSDGNNATITSATTSNAGLMTKAIFDEHVVNNAKVSNVDETTTSISLSSNILTYTDEDGTDTDLDLSLYLDDTNLSRLTSGSIDGTTGEATFTRSDNSTFTIDMSDFLDAITLNNTLTSTSTTEGLTAAQGKVLKDLIDGLNVGTGSNTGDETSATLSNEGIAFLASQAEVNAGTNTSKIVTPSRLKSMLGFTGTLSTTLTYTEEIGNAVLTTIPVTHSIGNQWVQASVYEGTTKVECEVVLTSASITTFKFNVAPTADQYRVVITG